LKLSRRAFVHTKRDAWVEVNLNALEHNIIQYQRALSTDLMAVLKADAYGHGAAMLGPTMEACGIKMFGVASMDEAIQLRDAGVEVPILVLGATPDWAMHYSLEYDIALTVFAEHHLQTLAELNASKPIAVHVKVDTGMHRIGVPWQQAQDFINRIAHEPSVRLEGIFTHLASGHCTETNLLQLSRWRQVLSQVDHKPPYVHIANSCGGLNLPSEALGSMVRVGIGFLGYDGHFNPPLLALKPLMGLKARVVHLQTLLPGEGVSYGHQFVHTGEQPLLLATLPLGYADGVVRGLSNSIDGHCRGQRVKQLGTITMDQLMVDVTGINDIQIGDVVTLLDAGQHEAYQGSTMTDWAQKLNTVEYELMCGLRVRLPKTFVRY
jgi:alanine racemase